MNDWVGSLAELLASERWEVTDPSTDPALQGFELVAENPVAVLFAAKAHAETLKTDAQALGAAVAAYLHARGGPKMWEGYLLLITDGYALLSSAALAEVQRDLTYCRKIVLNAEMLSLASDAAEILREEMALLFPLRLEPSGRSISVPALLEEELEARGIDRLVAHGLIGASDDPTFDAVEYLRRTGDPLGEGPP